MKAARRDAQVPEQEVNVEPVTQGAEAFGWWVCACVKRNRKGVMTHLKEHAPTVERCRVCGVTKAQSEAAGE